MKRIFLLFNLAVLLVLSSSTNAQDFVPGEIMIDIKHEYLPISLVPDAQGIIETGLPSIDSLNALFGVYDFETSVDTSSELNKGVLLFKFLQTLNVDDVLSSYLTDPHVSVASPNYIPHPDVIPDDHFFPQQWGLSKMKCPEAWRYTNGSPEIIIMILDGGTSYGHPDLVHNIWQNLGEDADGDGHTIEWNPAQNRWVFDPGDVELPNGRDNDGNGYCDDLVGFDFRDPPCGLGYGFDPQPTREPPFEWEDHGDKTAGTAAAVTNNWITEDEAEGVCWSMTETAAGASWFSKIMIARMDDNWDARDAIDYAIDRGANIINMSWGQSGDNPLLHQKVDEAWNAGLLLVASAGGDSSTARRYPAAYENVIAVAGTDNNDVKAPYSNWGTWVDICAPWGNVAPSRDINHFAYYCYDSTFSGTSASAPFVAGVAALVWACNDSATNEEVRDAVISTADNIYGIPGNYPYIGKLGSGRVNALRAVQVLRPNPPASNDCNANGIVDLGDVNHLTNYLYGNGPPPDPVCVGDVNDDGIVNVGDVVYLVGYLFKGGPAPLDGCD